MGGLFDVLSYLSHLKIHGFAGVNIMVLQCCVSKFSFSREDTFDHWSQQTLNLEIQKHILHRCHVHYKQQSCLLIKVVNLSRLLDKKLPLITIFSWYEMKNVLQDSA